MKYTPLQLDIIKRFGKKELTDGCLVKMPKYASHPENIHTILQIDKCHKNSEKKFIVYYTNSYRFVDKIDDEILGHILHLEDVFRVAEEKGLYLTIWQDVGMIYVNESKYSQAVTNFQYNPTLPLLEQPESTLQELLSLFNQ